MIERRPCAESDYEFLLDVYAASRRAELTSAGWREPELARFVRMQFELQQHHYGARYPGAEHSVVLVGGARAGQVRVFRARAEHLLVDVALAPAYQGHGLGGRLILDVVEQAHAAGVALRLSVRPDNPARRLYERLGFHELGNDDASVVMLCRPGAARRGPPLRPRASAG